MKNILRIIDKIFSSNDKKLLVFFVFVGVLATFNLNMKDYMSIFGVCI
jgi:hypothetical protein